MDTIYFHHHVSLPAVSATDRLLTAIKHLQDAMTDHLVTATPTEEKAIKTLHGLLMPPAHHKLS